MRVIQAMAGAEHGGAEAFFVRLSLAFHRAGVEQEVIIRGNKARKAALEAGGVTPIELPFGGVLDFETGRRFRDAARRFNPDIVMTWMNRASVKCPKGNFIQIGRLGGYYDLKYYKRCRHLVGNTEDIVEHIVKRGWPAERAHYLPNFVSEERAAPLPRKALYTPDKAYLVLALGRLHENKAFDVLLRAIARVPNTYLWLAGEGPLRVELESLAEELGIKPRVRFLGWREDTPALFATADLFVCPSRHEPLGNVVLEAWAQEVPVVAADSFGPGTLISPNENGVLAPVDDHERLAKTIRAVLEDRDFAARIARQGRAAYDAEFTEKAAVRKYMDFFQSVLTDGPA